MEELEFTTCTCRLNSKERLVHCASQGFVGSTAIIDSTPLFPTIKTGKIILRKKRTWGAYPLVAINDPVGNATKNFPPNRVTTTKYTAYNFIPKNLFEQFRRATNIYFLVVCIITLIPSVSPLTPVTSILPLVFVLAITALKEGYEDYRRMQADKQINYQTFEILENGQFIERYSKDIKVGDILRVQCDQAFPADMLLLGTPLEDGACYIETAQLDGETNLKLFKALPAASQLGDQVIHIKGVIEAEVPNSNLYKFHGNVTLADNAAHSLNEKHLLLRGSQLRNTPFIIGVVLYTGKDTKLSLNQKSPPSKFSTIERRLNKCVIAIFVFKMMCVILLTGLGGHYIDTTERYSFYLWNVGPFEENSLSVLVVQSFFAYFAILSFIIPMSLMVTLEVVKVSQIQFMEWDEMMSESEGVQAVTEVKEHEAVTNTKSRAINSENTEVVANDVIEISPDSNKGNSTRATGGRMSRMRKVFAKSGRTMSAKNSNLNDELGLVQYVFSDKTGTLTENHMEFSKCSIAGVIYDAGMRGQLRDKLMSHHYKVEDTFEPIKEFLLDMAICHSAIPAPKDGRIVYQSQSPDEVALCDAARANGFEFLGRTNEGISISVLGENLIFTPLAMLEFSSERRRMSVIVRRPDGHIVLYCKGADSVMSLLRRDEPQELLAKTREDLTRFSTEGLRTLLLGYREISPEEWDVWYTDYHRANTSIANRDQMLDEVALRIECDLRLIGVTAIEDRLQDGVPETIDFLLKANIRVWIITGDKQETAINIGHSCKLLSPDLPLIVLNAYTSAECKRRLEEALAEHTVAPNNKAGDKSRPGVSLVVDGDTLVFALAEHSQLFLQLASLCRSVVCCRVTPLQKALVVRVVKQATKAVCLAIGDGANDVSMIQEANIGVGVFGKEGTQAARASDYALLRFRHIARLIAVHGRYSMLRNSGVIKYSFYKNIAFFFVQFWFSFFNGYSAQTIYDAWVVTLFNVLFTAVPPYFMALFEKDIDEDIIMKYPQLYKRCQQGHLFTYYSVLWWVLNGVFHSFLFFFATYFLFRNDVVSRSGWSADLAVIGFVASTFGVFVVTGKAALETRYWNWLVHAGIWGSLLLYIITCVLDSAFYGIAYYGFYIVLGMPLFYMIVLLMIVACLLPDFTVKFLRHCFSPEDWHVLKERKLYMLPDIDEPGGGWGGVELPHLPQGAPQP